MDGFHIGGKFYCKKLGLLKVGSEKATSYFFDIDLRWNELSEKDKRMCGYVIRKLPFGVPRGWKAMPLQTLPAIVQEFFTKHKQNGESCLAYKGGHLERDLLTELQIPSVNLFKVDDFSTLFLCRLLGVVQRRKNVEKVVENANRIDVEIKTLFQLQLSDIEST